VPTKKLTDMFVERVKPPTRGRVEYFDASFGGLALRVTTTGHKSWSLHYRFGGRLRRFTIGRYPAIKPKDARREAQAALERVRQGVDPSAEKKMRSLAPPPETDTFALLLADYLERHASPNTSERTFKQTKRLLERDVMPAWGKLPILSITRVHAISLIDGIAAKGAKVTANRILARLRHLFNWAVERGRLPASPMFGMKPPRKERSRDRVLSDDELHWIWLGCDGRSDRVPSCSCSRRSAAMKSPAWNGRKSTSKEKLGPFHVTARRMIGLTKYTYRIPPSVCCAPFHTSATGTYLTRTAVRCPASHVARIGSTPR
jgi:hypothetical protein